MIKYALKCANDHQFESWFQSASAFDKLERAMMVACPQCGNTDVRKAVMAPRVSTEIRTQPANEPPSPGAAGPHALTEPGSPAESALRELREKIEANSEYVGREFASEARAIHEGGAPERSIYGESTAEDAKALLEDGIPVAPLPFTPKRKTN